MTERYKSATVVFDRDVREDDIEPLLDAMRCLRGIADIKPNPVDFEDYEARARIKRELAEKVFVLWKGLTEI